MAKSKWELYDIGSKMDLIEGWARNGLTEKQIAKNLGIGRTTLNTLKHDHPELLEHLKNGKVISDTYVENALYKRAVGYSFDEKTTEVKIEKDSNGVTSATPVAVKTTTKHIPPDTTAQIFWLKNRRPDVWKDKHELTGDLDREVKIEVVHTYQESDRHFRDKVPTAEELNNESASN